LLVLKQKQKAIMATKKPVKKPTRSPAKARPAPRKKKALPVHKRRLFMLPLPLVLFLLLAIGVMLIGWTFKSIASDSLIVKARVAAPLPMQPALITSPGNGSHFKDSFITISGSCPTENYSGNYVSFYKNNIYGGSVICRSDDTFQIQTVLLDGANTLKVQIFNMTDDPGPSSDPITVYFDRPAAQLPSETSSTEVPPFLVKTDFSYKGYYVGETVKWDFEATGGKPPYVFNVDWGDGQSELVRQPDQGVFSIEHTYKKPGGDKQQYPIKVNGVDVTGRRNFIQIFVTVTEKPSNAVVAQTTPSSGTPSLFGTAHWLVVLWPAYTTVVLMTMSFWLGEREELFTLRHKGAVKKRFT
jgi:hypothetical protein